MDYESPKDANQQVFAQLGEAFQAFFKKQAGYPKFKKKGASHDAFYVSNDKFELTGKRVRLPKMGWVKMREALRLSGKIISATVSRTADRWFLAVQVEIDPPSRPRETQAGVVGVDLGVKSLAVLSSGEVIEGPKPMQKLLNQLQRLSRQLSRKVHRSANWHKAKAKLARLHHRMAHIRRDAIHKLTTGLCRDFEVVVIEDLHVKGMMRNHRLACAISDMGLGLFRTQMGYKPEVYGSHVVVANRWFPSSRLCPKCGGLHELLTLSDRLFVCPHCGYTADRDWNAACNLQRYPWLAGNRNACGLPSAGPLSSLREVRAMFQAGATQQDEAGIQRVRLTSFEHK